MMQPPTRTSSPSTLLEVDPGQFTKLERTNIRFIRSTFDSPPVDRAVRSLQQHVGARRIELCTRNLRHVHGLSRLPDLTGGQSLICVANHRSFFDLYVVTMLLMRQGMRHRIVFPVRSKFFYDAPLGPVVNGLMSFFAMYPPIFRDRNRLKVNRVALREVSGLLQRDNVFVGLHPEGRRNPGDDPYSFLPPQSGVGQVIYEARVPVVPVFVNGLGNDIVKQIRSNWDGTGGRVHVVFGAPLKLDTWLQRAATPATYKSLAGECLSKIADLGREERILRAQDGRS